MVRIARRGPEAGDAGLSPLLRLFSKGIAIRCPVVARLPGREDRDRGLLQLLEANGDRPRQCRPCAAWFWRERKREYCGSCFQSGTARSKVHRAKAKAVQVGTRLP